MEICDSGLRYRCEPKFLNLFAKVLRDERLDDFLLQFIGEATPNQARRSLAAPESRHPCHFLIARHERFQFVRDSVRGNLNRNLALAFA
jgi:hypothetical protein